MVVCRIIGWAFVLAALSALGFEIMQAVNAGAWRPVALGEIWFKLDAASLNTAQAGIQRYVAPWLWEPVITSILLLPGWAVFGVPGLAMVWLCRRRDRRRNRKNVIF